MPPRTLYEKIWESHVVHDEPGQPSLIYIDRHLVHEGTSPQAFAGLKAAGRKVRRPELTFAVMDHSVSTKNRALAVLDPGRRGSIPSVGAELQGIWHQSVRHEQPESRHRPRDRTRNSASRSRVARSCAATATPPRTVRSVLWPSASAPAKSSTCSPRSAFRSLNQRQ